MKQIFIVKIDKINDDEATTAEEMESLIRLELASYGDVEVDELQIK